jgi:hypothetical protein
MPSTKKHSYLQLKVSISETTPTGLVVLDALMSDDPQFLKQYGLGPKMTRANKLLWLAYLGLTQGHNPNEIKLPEPVNDDFDLPIAELKITKADENTDEDSLDEDALMGGFI